MRLKTLILHKATASSVNIAVVSGVTSPVYFLAGPDWWRAFCIGAFFLYALLLPQRCLGQMIAGTYQNKPTNLVYAALYTAGFMTVIYWIWFPFDLMLVNGLCVQMPCLLVFGNTLHGLATGRQTMTEDERIFECIALKGECPDCSQAKLAVNGYHAMCKSCCSTFFLGDVSVRRVSMQMPVKQNLFFNHISRDMPLSH